MASNLDDLLDDALADFDKPSPSCGLDRDCNSKEVSRAPGSLLPNATQGPKTEPNTGDRNGDSAPAPSRFQAPNVFSEFFDEDMSAKLQQEWDSAMKELVQDDPQLASHLESFSHTLANATPPDDLGGAGESSTTSSTDKTPLNLNEAMKSTISGMQKSAEEVKNLNETSAEEKLLRDMKNMGLGFGGQGDFMGEMGDVDGLEGNFMSMMEGMMKNLLSRDVLYPTMKQMSEVYPGWLETNEGKIPPKDHQRYKKQSVVINKIVQNFDSVSDSDNEAIKKQKLNELMDLVEEMQGYGNPPPQMMEGCGPPVDIDMSKLFGEMPIPEGNLNAQDMNPENCIVM